uniref:GPI alpha-1,4-mannosyltransferase I, catalytic subunit n=1 Tax=Esox lucius TaxID=8010 RepID=A0A6Q2XDI8_ESOLU
MQTNKHVLFTARTTVVKYTDIDYHVFTDAARFITQGQSPYNRSTYRYTPLLAWILTPNIYLNHIFGNLLFITCDVLSGHVIYHILRQRGLSCEAACGVCSQWLLNPLPMAGVSSSANAELILAVLVLATLLCLELNRLVTAAMLYSLAVHMIYPVTYVLPIALSLQAFRLLNKELLLFAGVSGMVFCGLNLLFYYIYNVNSMFFCSTSSGMCLLPVVLPRLTIKKGLGIWFAGQGIWLTPAYYLEFEGYNTFLLIWLAGLLFLIINSFIMVQIISHYKPSHTVKSLKAE